LISFILILPFNVLLKAKPAYGFKINPFLFFIEYSTSKPAPNT